MQKAWAKQAAALQQPHDVHDDIQQELLRCPLSILRLCREGTLNPKTLKAPQGTARCQASHGAARRRCIAGCSEADTGTLLASWALSLSAFFCATL